MHFQFIFMNHSDQYKFLAIEQKSSKSQVTKYKNALSKIIYFHSVLLEGVGEPTAIVIEKQVSSDKIFVENFKSPKNVGRLQNLNDTDYRVGFFQPKTGQLFKRQGFMYSQTTYFDVIEEIFLFFLLQENNFGKNIQFLTFPADF